MRALFDDAHLFHFMGIIHVRSPFGFYRIPRRGVGFGMILPQAETRGEFDAFLIILDNPLYCKRQELLLRKN